MGNVELTVSAESTKMLPDYRVDRGRRGHWDQDRSTMEGPARCESPLDAFFKHVKTARWRKVRLANVEDIVPGNGN